MRALRIEQISRGLRRNRLGTEQSQVSSVETRSACDLERAIFEIKIAETELRTASVADVRRGIAASIACRAAIKINTPLDQRKMEWLLRALAATQYPMACPHGRPVALQYSTRDILKSFHRI